MSYYDCIAPGYNALYGDEQLAKVQRLDKEAKIRGLILDVGAGTCLVAKYFRARGRQVISIDPGAKLLKQGLGATVIGRAEQLPFKAATFDTVVSVTALHHCTIQQALTEIKRVAKEDAVVAISFLKVSARLQSFAAAFRKVFGKCKKIDIGKDILFLSE